MAQDPAMSLGFLFLLVALLSSERPASTLPDDGNYKIGDHIPLFANKIHSLNNSCLAYSYFDFPFCPPGSPITIRKKSYEEVIQGDCFTNTLYDLKFKADKIGETLCEKHLTKDEVEKFRNAVKNKFDFQMYYNNIRLSGRIGKVEAKAGRLSYYLIKHISFYAYYIENQVKDIYLMSDFDSAVDITEDVGIKVKFTYSVFWKELKINSDKYGWPTEQQGSWDIVVFFICLAAIIYCWFRWLLVMNVPYLSNYITRYSNRDVEEPREMINLKQIHGDSCKCPPYSSLLGAILGIGTQLLLLLFSLFFLAFKGLLHRCNPETLFTYLLLIYCFASFFSGFVATSFHSQYTAIGWKKCIFQTGVLYFVPVFITALVISKLKINNYGLLDLPEFSNAVVILLIWGLGTISFLSLGGKIGYAYRSNPQAFCTTSRSRTARREKIPQPASWYMKTPAQMFIGGLLPFMTIFWEMDKIYASLWELKVCGAFKTLLTDFIVVVILTIILGMGFTVFQLCQQDYQWWWRSVLRGGSTAIFMFAYGIYFHTRTVDARDFMKLLPFMGYNACIFYAFFLILGTIGFSASEIVFCHMYLQGACSEVVTN